MSRFEPAPMARRDLILVIISGVVALGVIIALVVILLRSGQPGQKEPIAPAAASPSGATPTVAPIVSPSPAGPPTVTPSPAPTPTLEPYQHKIKAGETLFAIIQMYGYREISVVPEIIRLNNMANENDLKADQVLLIPRQTPTLGPTSTQAPTLPPGTTPTATVEVTVGPTLDYKGCSPTNICVSADRQYYLHEVKEGDSIASIAYAYNSLPDAVMKANGSPGFIVPGQQILIPILVTMTPTLTPTGGPGSTATPVPTFSPPSLLAPAKGETFGRADAVILQWVTVNSLAGNQYYMVIIRNVGTEQEHRATTHSNSYLLPDSLRPGLGQSAQFEWRVVVVSGAETTAPPISGQGPAWTFTWGP